MFITCFFFNKFLRPNRPSSDRYSWWRCDW